MVLKKLNKKHMNTKKVIKTKKVLVKRKFYFNSIFFKFLLKKGNINKATTIFKETFYILFNETGLGCYAILTQICTKLYITFEVRRVRVRRNSHLVPVPLTLRRRYYLICKWVFDAVKINKTHENFSKKLASEIIKIFKNQSCESITKKKLVQTTAISNRANAHYRWY